MQATVLGRTMGGRARGSMSGIEGEYQDDLGEMERIDEWSLPDFPPSLTGSSRSANTAKATLVPIRASGDFFRDEARRHGAPLKRCICSALVSAVASDGLERQSARQDGARYLTAYQPRTATPCPSRDLSHDNPSIRRAF